MKLRMAQAAMEFLLTYGWAIMVVLVVIGALAYFGVLSPSNLLPEKCTFPVSFSCRDFDVGSNGVQVTIQNGGGKDIKVTSVSFTSEALNSLSGSCSTGAISAVVNNGAQATFYATDPLNCGFKDTGRQKNKYGVQIIYQSADSELSHTASGELLARAGSSAVSEGSGGYGGGSGDVSLVGYWRFEEGSGTSASDFSSYVNTGTLSGFDCTTLDCSIISGWTSAGKIGKGVTFDGVDDYLVVGDSPSLNPSAITFTAWLKPNTASLQAYIAAKFDGGPQPTYYFYWDGITDRVSIGTNGTGGGERFSSSVFTDNNAWVHVAVTDDASGNIRFYRNGVPAGTPAAAAIGSNNKNLIIGARGAGGGAVGFFSGAIDEVAIYNRALSASEIAALAAP